MVTIIPAVLHVPQNVHLSLSVPNLLELFQVVGVEPRKPAADKNCIVVIHLIELLSEPAGLQETSSTETFALQDPCQGWLEAPIRPWEWNGPLSTRD